MLMKFWGTRGSIPVPGEDTLRYGGNTPCVEIRASNKKLLVLDAGSGIRKLGNQLDSCGFNEAVNILISHYHWDHIQGIPFFTPLYNKRCKINFYGQANNEGGVSGILSRQMNSINFPIQIDELSAEINFNPIGADKEYDISDLKIETLQANHSAPTLCYKISENDKSIVYLTDNELAINEGPDLLENFEELNKNLIDFCKNCNYLIHDTMYDEVTLKEKRGWGHSGNISLAYFSMVAEIKNLILFHYNPDYTDVKIDQMLEETKNYLSQNNSPVNCIAAKEGMEIEI